MKQKKILPPWANLLYPILLFLGGCTVVVHLAQGHQLLKIWYQSTWWLIFVAAIFQVSMILNTSALYRVAYRMARLPGRLGHIFMLVLASSFTVVAVPGGALSGIGLMVYDTVRKGGEATRAVLANIIFFMLDYLAFIIILIPALLYMLFHGVLKEYQIIATGCLFALVIVGLLLIFLTALNPSGISFFGKRLTKLLRFVPCFTKLNKKYSWGEKLNNFILGLSDAIRTMRTNPKGLFQAVLHALLMEAIGLLQLEALFLSFGAHPTLGQLISGYAVGVLFMIVSITPSGVGIMEGAMTAAYVSVGIPLGKAALVTFTFRALSFWLPIITGSFAIRRVIRE